MKIQPLNINSSYNAKIKPFNNQMAYKNIVFKGQASTDIQARNLQREKEMYAKAMDRNGYLNLDKVKRYIENSDDEFIGYMLSKEIAKKKSSITSKKTLEIIDEVASDWRFDKKDLLNILLNPKYEQKIRIYDYLSQNETIKLDIARRITNSIKTDNSIDARVVLASMISQDDFSSDSAEVDLNDLFHEVNKDNIYFWAKIHQMMKKTQYDDETIRNIMLLTNINNSLYTEKALQYIEKLPNFPKDIATHFILKAGRTDFVDESIEQNANLIKRANEIRKIMLDNPELYVEGEYGSKEEMQNRIDGFLDSYLFELVETMKVFDKETTLTLLRERFSKAMIMLRKVSRFHEDFGLEEIEILSMLINAKNIDGREFLPKEKIEFVDLVGVYRKYLPQEKCRNLAMMAYSKPEKVDILKIQNDILEFLFEKCNVDKKYIETMSDEERKHWINNCHHIFQAKETLKDFGQIIKIAFECENFKSYLNSKDNKKYNSYLDSLIFFGANNLDFNSWLNPNADDYVQFKTSDTSQDRIQQIISQIEEDFDTLLLCTPAENFINKHFSEFIESHRFFIPEKYQNKQALETFLKSAYELLNKNVFKRAQRNIEDENNPYPKITLMIKNHLEQRFKDIEELDNTKTKSLDLTIKMWDRDLKKDIFQGNYSSCCIGIGHINQSAIIDYLEMPMFNMIELIDNKTNQTVGNALCYFAQDNENKKPVFIIDNIEIAPKYKPSDKTSVELRNAIIKYCKNIIKSVGADDETPIYLGKKYNDIQSADLKTINKKIVLLENKEQLYLDAFGGWVWGQLTHQKMQEFYVLN